ncbi:MULTISPECIES: hypothetical protein [Acidithiobacillus]|uniref:hypothetical protein n=1 Tax=Acidithiobacillus TaxID=119977 RepID=UPI0013018CB3|nr:MULTISPECIES: hypothetical protein [Acidithiobacillus]MBE7563691.1 hypothetical protein [Acidithiobacillus sp. HP-6]MBE7569430.1 hypothetical protein [Acidithiobacillus sp. HP-2]
MDFHEAEMGNRCHIPGSEVIMDRLSRFAAQGFFVVLMPPGIFFQAYLGRSFCIPEKLGK